MKLACPFHIPCFKINYGYSWRTIVSNTSDHEVRTSIPLDYGLRISNAS